MRLVREESPRVLEMLRSQREELGMVRDRIGASTWTRLLTGLMAQIVARVKAPTGRSSPVSILVTVVNRLLRSLIVGAGKGSDPWEDTIIQCLTGLNRRLV